MMRIGADLQTMTRQELVSEVIKLRKGVGSVKMQADTTSFGITCLKGATF